MNPDPPGASGYDRLTFSRQRNLENAGKGQVGKADNLTSTSMVENVQEGNGK